MNTTTTGTPTFTPYPRAVRTAGYTAIYTARA
jgi:hypothetical protein